MSSQARFFTLPREVRDSIYTLVLSTPTDPLSSPREAGLRYKEEVGGGWDIRCVFYPPPSTFHGPASALSQCSHKIRQEVSELVTKRSLTKGVTYELDVMLKGGMLWPTWINLPYPVTKMDHLQANLRLFDVRDGDGLFWGAGGPGLTFVVLFSLLNRLLHHGPRFLYKKGMTQGLEIDQLTINVMPGYGKVLQPDDGRFRDEENPMLKCEQHVERDHKRIYQFICRHIDDVVRQGLLFGKVQTLKICLGDTMTEYLVKETTPEATPSAKWRTWGFVWGVDDDMKTEKVESSSFLDHLYRQEHEEQED
ncbi:MAG: hypothetical protein Q9166_006230 [cf. Caloplaca sp. 2 TL-2023]